MESDVIRAPEVTGRGGGFRFAVLRLFTLRTLIMKSIWSSACVNRMRTRGFAITFAAARTDTSYERDYLSVYAVCLVSADLLASFSELDVKLSRVCHEIPTTR